MEHVPVPDCIALCISALYNIVALANYVTSQL